MINRILNLCKTRGSGASPPLDPLFCQRFGLFPKRRGRRFHPFAEVSISVLIIGLSSVVFNPVRAAIVYVRGPSFSVPALYSSESVDLNQDGTPDFTFSSQGMLCTADVPTSACSWPFYVSAGGSNEMLLNGFQVQAQPRGVWIGGSAPANAVWSSPNFAYGSAGLAYWWWHRVRGAGIGPVIGTAAPEDSSTSTRFDSSPELPEYESGWSGSLGDLGVGYLGVRFRAEDGWHYGWIRVRLPANSRDSFFGFTPVVVDWAYEAQPDTPIQAGAVNRVGGPKEFTVTFWKQVNGRRPTRQQIGGGAFILVDDVLRGELFLAEECGSVSVSGLSLVPFRPRNAGDTYLPLISNEDYTAFFVELTLTPPQIGRLLSGAGEVSVDHGKYSGRLEPVRATIGRPRERQ